MTELKRICPFCGGEMIGSNGHPICHYNPNCIIYDEIVPQQLLDLLADTKKKLDKAKHRLMQIAYLDMTEHGIGSDKMMIDWCKTVASTGLKEIEEKEQQ